MLKKATSWILLALLVIGISEVATNIKSAKASNTIYIRVDGSIDPPSAPISSVDNVTYTLTNNISDSIFIERDNIILDGAGNTLQKTGTYNYGIRLIYGDNITVRNFNIKSFDWGIGLWFSSNNRIHGNNITENDLTGILLDYSSNNVIYGNDITENSFDGIFLEYSSNYNTITENNITANSRNGITLSDSFYNKICENNVTRNNADGIIFDFSANSNIISGNNVMENGQGISILSGTSNGVYHNNFVNNTNQASSNLVNVWDGGYPSGGNYWSDYAGTDLYRGSHQNETGSDGIGDTPYTIDSGNTDGYPLMNPWSEPWEDWRHYHNYSEIFSTLLHLNLTYPNLVNVFSIGKSWQNRDIYCIRLTDESNTHPKPKLFFVGYHHAREPISAELPLYFVVEAVTNFGINATLTHMLKYSEIYIVPALNVDAFDVVKQNEWQRKNVHPYDEDGDGLLDEDPPVDTDGDGSISHLYFWNGTYYSDIRYEGIDTDGDGKLDWVGGVDLNRNYGYQWNATCDSGSPYPSAEDYRGPTPFSEPETQAIRDLALSNNFKYAISLHSGTEVIGYPWGYTTDPTLDDAIFREIAANLSQLVGAPYGQNSGLYTTSGVWDDWMYANRSTFALTCEIYTNNSAWQYEPGPDPDTWWEKGVFQFFNPDPNNIETVIHRWLPVFTYTTNRAITEAYNTATTNVTPLKTIVGQGYTMNINVTITNKGDYTEMFNVTVYANITPIQTQTITLTSGNSTTVTFPWNTSGFVKGNYTIWAYALPVPGETDTADNILTDGMVTVALVGDVNADGIVDIEDIYLISLAYGTMPGQPGYKPNLDINADGIIDIADIYTAALHYGETDP